jgi:hypothetical protein
MNCSEWQFEYRINKQIIAGRLFLSDRRFTAETPEHTVELETLTVEAIIKELVFLTVEAVYF